MILVATCSFCDEELSKGTGLMYAKKDGTIYRFCGGKCKKNYLKLGREGRRQKWTPASRKFKAMQNKRSAAKAEGASAKKPASKKRK